MHYQRFFDAQETDLENGGDPKSIFHKRKVRERLACARWPTPRSEQDVRLSKAGAVLEPACRLANAERHRACRLVVYSSV